MSANILHRRKRWLTGGASTVIAVSLLWATWAARDSHASWPWQSCACTGGCQNACPPYFVGDGVPPGELGGTWYWLRSPEEEKRVTIGLFNRYCIRCHGVDGRGVWDIPDVPNFTHPAWQASRTDPQLVRIILEGRGAVMPPFRGTLTLEEAWAMARYLRTFLPGTETSRPEMPKTESQVSPPPDGMPKQPESLLLPQPRSAPETVPTQDWRPGSGIISPPSSADRD
jgi:mono/diheme cytochrome c family protein